MSFFPTIEDDLLDIDTEFDRDMKRLELEMVQINASIESNDDSFFEAGIKPVAPPSKTHVKYQKLTIKDKFKIVAGKIVAAIRRCWDNLVASVHKFMRDSSWRIGLEAKKVEVKHANVDSKGKVEIPDYDAIAKYANKSMNEINGMLNDLKKAASKKRDTAYYENLKNFISTRCKELEEGLVGTDNKKGVLDKKVSMPPDAAIENIKKHCSIFTENSMFGASKTLKEIELLGKELDTLAEQDRITGDTTIGKVMHNNHTVNIYSGVAALTTGALSIIAVPFKAIFVVISKTIQYILSKSIGALALFKL